MTERQNTAVELFSSGSNCAQATLTAFSDKTGKSREDLAAMAASLGGGMGKMQLTCGAVTGSFILFGLLASRETITATDAKDQSGAMVREFASRFSKVHGSLNCKDLIGVDMNTEEGKRELAEKNIHQVVCSDIVALAVGIIEEMLAERDAERK